MSDALNRIEQTWVRRDVQTNLPDFLAALKYKDFIAEVQQALTTVHSRGSCIQMCSDVEGSQKSGRSDVWREELHLS